ncbi:MAG: hypothetical protein RMK75_02405 [Aquificaceae bacterium]|nr:hypothetical protein [Aquificaceae bacterium]MDW8423160.1 hypothetical protein [Aquificaceae bacterium]
MRKVLLILAFGSTIISLANAQPANMGRHQHKLWCQQNWEKCKQFKEETLGIKERSLARERECLQKAKDFWGFEECMAQAKVQTRKEMLQLRQKFMGGVDR